MSTTLYQTDWNTALPAVKAGLQNGQITIPTTRLDSLDGSIFEGGLHKHVATYTLDAGKKFNITELPKVLDDQFFNVVVRWITVSWLNGAQTTTTHARMLYPDAVTRWSIPLYNGEVIYNDCCFDIYITNPATLFRSIDPIVLKTSINSVPAANYITAPVGIVNEEEVTGDDVYAHPFGVTGDIEDYQPKFTHRWQTQLELVGADYFLRDDIGDVDLKNFVQGVAPTIGAGEPEAESLVGTVLECDGANGYMTYDTPIVMIPAEEMWVMFQFKPIARDGFYIARSDVGSIGFGGANLYWSGGNNLFGHPGSLINTLVDEQWYFARLYIKTLGTLNVTSGHYEGTVFAIEIRDLADKRVFSSELTLNWYRGNVVEGWQATVNMGWLALTESALTDAEVARLWKWLRGRYSTWILGLDGAFNGTPPVTYIGAHFEPKLYGVENTILNQETV